LSKGVVEAWKISLKDTFPVRRTLPA